MSSGRLSVSGERRRVTRHRFHTPSPSRDGVGHQATSTVQGFKLKLCAVSIGSIYCYWAYDGASVTPNPYLSNECGEVHRFTVNSSVGMADAATIAASNSPAAAISLRAARVGSRSCGLGMTTALAPLSMLSSLVPYRRLR